MATRHDDGSVTLATPEVAQLERLVDRWHRASELPGTAAGDAVLDLAMEVRELLDLHPPVRQAHQHEAWQIREAPDGSRYCAACGGRVLQPVAP